MPRLTAEAETALILAYQAGDERAFEALERAHRGFVYATAIRLAVQRGWLDREDARAAGVRGLWQAVRRFDTTRKLRLLTYAYYWILQEVEATNRQDRSTLGSLSDLIDGEHELASVLLAPVNDRDSIEARELIAAARASARMVLASFPAIARKAIIGYHVLGYTHAKLGRRLGLPKQRVSQVLAEWTPRFLHRVRAEMGVSFSASGVALNPNGGG